MVQVSGMAVMIQSGLNRNKKLECCTDIFFAKHITSASGLLRRESFHGHGRL